MSSVAGDAFVNAMVQDSWLTNPAGLLAALREPAGRMPDASSLAVAEAFSSIDDTRALAITSAILDAAYFSMLNLLDGDLKNSGVEVRFRASSDEWLSSDPSVLLHELYRDRVGPNGSVRKPS